LAKRTSLGWAAHFVNKSLKAAGLSVSKLPERNTLERQIKSLFAQFEVQCVIDVGAHFGEFATSLRENGYTGRIVSFEPFSESFAKLREARGADKQWDIQQLCLGSDSQTVEIRTFKHSQFNSLHNPTDFAKEGWYSEDMIVQGTESVSMKRLDAVLPDLGIDPGKVNIYLKIDTQGHDMEVLQGASRVLPKIKALQTELSALRLYQDSPRLEEALTRYRELGFLPAGFYPIQKDDKPLPVAEWDCIFTRVEPEYLQGG
jgi:FkbM family methyltransferase